MGSINMCKEIMYEGSRRSWSIFPAIHLIKNLCGEIYFKFTGLNVTLGALRYLHIIIKINFINKELYLKILRYRGI